MQGFFYFWNYNLEIIDEVKKLINESTFLNDLGDLNELIILAKYNPLKNIKEQILLLGKIVGFTSVKDIIFLLNIEDSFT